MSLKVWLPLDGNLRNLGTSDIKFTNNGATTDASGKIGTCYAFNGSNNNLTFTPTGLNALSEISIALWLYTTTAKLTGACFSLEYSSYWQITIQGNSLEFRDDSIGLTATRKTYSIGDFTPNAWTHLAITYNKGNIKIYKNGILTNNYTTGGTKLNSPINNGRIGSAVQSGYYYNGKLNDVRIYDHALSAAEVHEISQGLLLHYKLDNQYMEIPTFLNSTISSTAYNASLGKYGYNTTSNLTKTEGVFQGKQSIKVSTIEEGQDAQPYSYFSNLFTSDGTNAPAYKALSFDYFTTCPTTTWINFYKLGSGTGSVTWKVINSSGTKIGGYINSGAISVKPNEWNHVEVVLHGTSTENAEWGYCVNGSKHTSNLDYYFLFANIQLEESDHVTGYGANLHNSIVTDSSGYGHDAQALNNPSISEDTPMYNYCIKLNGSNQAIKVLDNNWMVQGMRAMTINLWVKSRFYTGAHFFSCTESGGFNTETGSSGYLRHPVHVYTNEAQTSTAYKYDSKEIEIAALSLTNWNMVTFVYDSTGTKTYINGELHHTYTNTSYGIHFNKNARLFLGCEANTASPSTPYFNGSLSDFRLYTTALTAEDIKALYDVRGRVDNLQKIHSYEFNETQTNLFRSELIMPFARNNITSGIGEIIEKNNEYCICIKPYSFYKNLENEESGTLVGYFHPNTSYVFDMWMDASEKTSSGNYSRGGFTIYYTDNTTDSTFLIQGSEGWQHKKLITPLNKSIKKIGINYYNNVSVLYRLDSFICKTDDIQITKTGLLNNSNIIEGNNIASFGKGGNIYSSEFIEI